MKGPGAAPQISFDYDFLSDGGEITSQEASESAGESAIKVLVVRDDKSKSMSGHVVPQKSIDEKVFATSSLVEDPLRESNLLKSETGRLFRVVLIFLLLTGWQTLHGPEFKALEAMDLKPRWLEDVDRRSRQH